MMTANVGTGKVADIMKHFLEMRDEPVFFILEIPTDLDDEKRLKRDFRAVFIPMFIISTAALTVRR